MESVRIASPAGNPMTAGSFGARMARRNGDSAAWRALGVDVERIERPARGHEQAVALGPAEAKIGAAFRQADAADQLALGREHNDAVELRESHAPAAPQIAVDVAPSTVRPNMYGVDEHSAVRQTLSAVH